MDNLYDILLVSQNAKKEEIRKAYRQLAAQYHPDRNPDPAATEKFRQITKAYEVLGDEDRRKLYDRYGDIALNPNFKGFEEPSSTNTGYDDFFSNFTGGSTHGTQSYQGSEGYDRGSQQSSGRYSRPDFSGDYWQTSSNYDDFGFGKSKESGFEPPEKGANIKVQIQLTLLDAINGCERRINVQRQTKWLRGSNAGMTQETVKVQVPKLTSSGDIIKMKGKGNPGKNGGSDGDLVVSLQVQPHPYLAREGTNLFLTVPLTMQEALFGSKIEVPTLTGTVRIQIPAGVKMGQKLRLKNRGVPKSTGGHGDFYLVLQPTVPETKSPKAIELAAELEKMYHVGGIRRDLKL